MTIDISQLVMQTSENVESLRQDFHKQVQDLHKHIANSTEKTRQEIDEVRDIAVSAKTAAEHQQQTFEQYRDGHSRHFEEYRRGIEQRVSNVETIVDAHDGPFAKQFEAMRKVAAAEFKDIRATQTKILWALIGLLLTILGSILGAGLVALWRATSG